jgi:hypothetical protein
MHERYISVPPYEEAKIINNFMCLQAYKNAKINRVYDNVNVDDRSYRQVCFIFWCPVNLPTALYVLFMFRSVRMAVM